MNDKRPQLARDDIFVNPIYRGHDPQFLYLDKECDSIIENIKKQNQIKLQNGDIKSLPNSYHSENLWQHEKFRPFIQFVMKQMWDILSSQGYDLKGRQPLLQECWVQEFPEEGGFHDPRPGKTMTDLKPLEKDKVNVCNSQVHYPVKPGQFIFFNSWMPHAYSHHKGKEKFRFIHFNMAAVVSHGSITNADKE